MYISGGSLKSQVNPVTRILECSYVYYDVLAARYNYERISSLMVQLIIGV